MCSAPLRRQNRRLPRCAVESGLTCEKAAETISQGLRCPAPTSKNLAGRDRGPALDVPETRACPCRKPTREYRPDKNKTKLYDRRNPTPLADDTPRRIDRYPPVRCIQPLDSAFPPCRDHPRTSGNRRGEF